MKLIFYGLFLLVPMVVGAQSTALDDDFHLNTILFERNAVLTPAAQQHLEELSHVMETDFLNDTCYLLAGHSDASGPATLNQTISEARAIAVKDFILASANTETLNIETVGLGETQLLPNASETSQLNRRVVIMAQKCS